MQVVETTYVLLGVDEVVVEDYRAPVLGHLQKFRVMVRLATPFPACFIKIDFLGQQITSIFILLHFGKNI
jgi:hypothetical protein